MIQNRKKAQYNLIDVLIIVFILGVIAASVYLLFGGFGGSEDDGTADITFEVRISNVKESALPLISKGLAVKDSITGEQIGTIVAVRLEKSRYYGSARLDENGDYALGVTEYPDEYDVYVTISSNAKSDDRGIYAVGETYMLIGETVHFQVKSFSEVSYIVHTEIPN
jgi:hypothetical protein